MVARRTGWGDFIHHIFKILCENQFKHSLRQRIAKVYSFSSSESRPSNCESAFFRRTGNHCHENNKTAFRNELGVRATRITRVLFTKLRIIG